MKKQRQYRKDPGHGNHTSLQYLNLNTNIPYGISIDIDKMTVKVKNFVTNFYLVLIQHSH